MPNIRRPRRGSVQFWPRKRAERIYAKVNSWQKIKEIKLLGFAGYKAGMTHTIITDLRQYSQTKNQKIFCPATVIECPPMKFYSIRFYKRDVEGLKLIGEIFNKNNNKELLRKIKFSKKEGKEPEDFDTVRLVAYTQPRLAGIGKKTPEIFEIELGGDDKKARLDLAKKLLQTEAKLKDVFKEGQVVDAHAVSKAKGFQGTVKRFGVRIRQHKSEKTKRGIGALGSWHPNKIAYTVAQPGKMGYHLRTDHNKLVLKISNKPEEINPAGGFLRYGLIKNDYILLKGSVPGPTKRLITITEPIRADKKHKTQPIEITHISLDSKQGLR